MRWIAKFVGIPQVLSATPQKSSIALRKVHPTKRKWSIGELPQANGKKRWLQHSPTIKRKVNGPSPTEHMGKQHSSSEVTGSN